MPKALHVIWDPNFQNCPTSYLFSSINHRSVFLQGIELIFGTEGHTAHFVPHLGYAFEGGSPKEIDSKRRQESCCHQRYVFLGKAHNAKSIPKTYTFDTIDEACCFEMGVKVAIPHCDYWLVPDATFRVLNFKKMGWIPEDIQTRILKLLKEKPHLEDGLAVNEKGEWIHEMWRLDEEIFKLE